MLALANARMASCKNDFLNAPCKVFPGIMTIQNRVLV